MRGFPTVKWMDGSASVSAACTKPRGTYSRSPTCKSQVGRRRQAVGGNRFITMLHLVRWHLGGVVQVPDLRSLDLQDQHVVVVVVGNEPSRSGRRDVSVDLCREVQLDLDGMGQRSNRAHVALNAVHNDREAIGKVVANADEIEAAIDKPIAIGAPLVFLPHQAHRRRLEAIKLQELVQRRRTRQQTVEVAGECRSTWKCRRCPDLVEKRLPPQGAQATRLATVRWQPPTSLNAPVTRSAQV